MKHKKDKSGVRWEEPKCEKRALLAKDVDNFLASGGEIKTIPIGVSGIKEMTLVERSARRKK